MNPPLIILTGPTAAGKTKLSIALARAVNGEIISADSMQVYRFMDIGTAKIRPEEMGGIQHHLVDMLLPDDEFHVVKFKEYAQMAIDNIYSNGKIPILVGGTGFYIQAVLNNIDFTEGKTDSIYRKSLEKLADEKGASYLHEQLRQIDPVSANVIHEHNIKRIIRAIEFYKQTGEPISRHNEKERKKISPYNFSYFVLTNERNILYELINKRVGQMIASGLVEEVKKLKEMGYTRDLVSMQGLGYKEIYAYLYGEISLEEAITILKRDTRHFAKRQLTWFKREKEVIWLDKSKFDDDTMILEEMLKELRNKAIIK